MKAFFARFAGWGQFGLECLDKAIANHGVPKTPHDWVPILGSAALALAVHFAAGTDGTK
jgi:hypothetical protein